VKRDREVGQRGLASLIIFLVTLMVAWVPLALAVAIPAASSRLLPALGNWMTANNRWIQVIVCLGFGIWLLAKGVTALWLARAGAAIAHGPRPRTAVYGEAMSSSAFRWAGTARKKAMMPAAIIRPAPSK
jgi:hypothetical protein